jgi:hypothetical protein
MATVLEMQLQTKEAQDAWFQTSLGTSSTTALPCLNQYYQGRPRMQRVSSKLEGFCFVVFVFVFTIEQYLH